MMIEGEGADVIPRTKENFVVVGVEMVFKKFGVPVPELAYFCKNGIPFGSGTYADILRLRLRLHGG